jgi:hypothetical protein
MTRRRIGVPDAFRRLPMSEEELVDLPSFRVIRVSTEAQDYRGGPEAQGRELDLAEERTRVSPTGLELRDASPGWDAGRLEPALEWAAERRVSVGLVPYFSRFMREPALAFAYRDAFHARGCVLYFADRRLLSSDPARQGDFADLAVRAQVDNLDRARAIAAGMYSKFRSSGDPGGHPAFGFRRAAGPRPTLEPDPLHIEEAIHLFELYATGEYTDESLALEASRLGHVAPMTGRALTAKGMTDLLRNPIYNGWVVRFRGFADEERVQAPWRVRTKVNPDGSTDTVLDPPVSDELWERVQDIRARRTTVAGRRRTDRVYVPNLRCHGCGIRLHGHAGNHVRRMGHPKPLCPSWQSASDGQLSFHAEIYEWQIAAILATARLDAPAKARIVAALGPRTPVPDRSRIRHIERELRELATENAFGRLPDETYLRAKPRLLAELEDARRPNASTARVEPARAVGYLEDLKSLWEIERPATPDHDGVWRTYEARRAEATSAAFARLTALGPELITAELADDPVTAAPLALTVRPERAVLTGDRARVMRQLMRGRPSRLRFSHNYEADRKRLQRERAGTLSCTGRGERTRTDLRSQWPTIAVDLGDTSE